MTETVSSDSVAQDQLRAFIERIERLEQEALLELYMAALGMAMAPPQDEDDE